MSRMLCFAAPRSLPTAVALGEKLLAEFMALSHVHSDGWGTAWRDDTGAVLAATGADIRSDADRIAALLAIPSRARLIYLRFASHGAPPAPENTQPFLRVETAFQHNGLLSPRDRAEALLAERDRNALQGNTDSEVYFAVVRRQQGPPPVEDASGIVQGAALMRSLFPDACLNAMQLSGAGLFVVHAAGSVAAPLAAFAQRGFPAGALPIGHDESYNVLSMTRSDAGARIVATTGVDQRGWVRLADESVYTVTERGVSNTRIPRVRRLDEPTRSS